MRKSVKKSLSKIKPAEYKMSVIKSLEEQLSLARDVSADLQNKLIHSRSVVLSLTARVAQLEKNLYEQQRRFNEDGYSKEYRWYNFWR